MFSSVSGSGQKQADGWHGKTALAFRCRTENNQWFLSLLLTASRGGTGLSGSQAHFISPFLKKCNFLQAKWVKVPLQTQEATSQCEDGNFLCQVGENGWYRKQYLSFFFLRPSHLRSLQQNPVYNDDRFAHGPQAESQGPRCAEGKTTTERGNICREGQQHEVEFPDAGWLIK